MQRFCVLTTGRAGSTALLDALAEYDDIAVPNKQVDCRDNEILRPDCAATYARQYQDLSGLTVHDAPSLLEAFFLSNQSAAYAGFKAMPLRDRQFMALLLQGNAQVITLTRNDVASTVASFIIAADAQTWRREGGRQSHRFSFGPAYYERAFAHLVYIHQSFRLLQLLPNAIHLRYEDLCGGAFECPALDAFFQRPVRLKAPKPPISGADYVDNWEEFCGFIGQSMQRITGDQQAGGPP